MIKEPGRTGMSSSCSFPRGRTRTQAAGRGNPSATRASRGGDGDLDPDALTAPLAVHPHWPSDGLSASLR